MPNTDPGGHNAGTPFGRRHREQRSSEGIFLPNFAQPEARPRRTAQRPILLQYEGITPETPCVRSSPLPRAILFRWGLRGPRKWEEFLWEVPTPSRGNPLPASFV